MGAMTYQTTSLTIVYSTVYSGADRKNIEAPRHWPLCERSPVTGEFPAQIPSSHAENASIWRRHHETLGTDHYYLSISFVQFYHRIAIKGIRPFSTTHALLIKTFASARKGYTNVYIYNIYYIYIRTQRLYMYIYENCNKNACALLQQSLNQLYCSPCMHLILYIPFIFY